MSSSYNALPPYDSKAVHELSQQDLQQLSIDIKHWGQSLGFQQIGITDTLLDKDEAHLLDWLTADRHGEMHYMKRHGTRRSRPAELIPGTIRIISARMDYLPEEEKDPETLLHDNTAAYLSRYALGRDYHKLIRNRLQTLATKIEGAIGPFGYRAFVDSAPVLEKALAEKAGLGWIGKHTNLINKKAGSWFFLGELYTDLPLPVDSSTENHCGNCNDCINICPTNAIIAPYELDARLCISYLTIELRSSIPIKLRPLIGNRIFGCDDCQLVCPWNRFAQYSKEQDFQPRHGLDASQLADLFLWSEGEFLTNTEGSSIRRIGHECWLRNIAVALGNSSYSERTDNTLQSRLDHPSELVREHVKWAIQQLKHNNRT